MSDPLSGSGRSRVSFTRKAILKKSEGGVTHDTEEAIEPLENDGNADDDDGASLFVRDKAKLASRGGHSLFEQLEANKEAKDEEWQAAHPKNMTEKVMDEEEFAFLNDQKQIRKQRESKKAAAERESLTAFAIARANHTVKNIASQSSSASSSTSSAITSITATGASSDNNNNKKNNKNSSTIRPRVGGLPKKGTATVLVRKRKLDDSATGGADSSAVAEKPIKTGGLMSLVGYGSSSDSDDESESEEEEEEEAVGKQQTESAKKTKR